MWFILESRHEGYSVALVEARVLKKLIVTSTFPANKEQIKNNKNGLIAKLEPNDLADKIYTMYSDPDLKVRILKNISQESINFDRELDKLNKI